MRDLARDEDLMDEAVNRVADEEALLNCEPSKREPMHAHRISKEWNIDQSITVAPEAVTQSLQPTS